MSLSIITGSKGFVGLNLVEYLTIKNKTTLGVSRNPLENEINYTNLRVDIINKAKSIIHLAGKAHDLKKTSEHKEYFEVNTELTKVIFDKFLESNCEVFVFMSSVKAVADVVEGKLEETVNPNPVTAYGKSKLAAENYILSKEIPRNKRVYILRPCMIHGPNNKGNLNVLYNFVSKGIPYPFGKFDNQRSFVSVDNLCFIINELIENKNIKSGIYNISDDEPLSTKKIVEIIGGSINKKTKILNLPKWGISIIAKIGNFIPIPINSEKVEKLTENFIVSNNKIRQAIKKDLPLNSKEGIKKTIKSYDKSI